MVQDFVGYVGAGESALNSLRIKEGVCSGRVGGYAA
jgi:hypothetical protein